MSKTAGVHQQGQGDIVIALRPPTLTECQLVREWRNDPAVLPTLRTGYKTEAEQATFYREIVCDPQSDHRYYALEHDGHFVGLGGMTYLSRVPGEAEISLILGPTFRSVGLGIHAVGALLREAERLGLRWVIGECLPSGPRLFWWAMWHDMQWPGWSAVSASSTSVQSTSEPGSFRWRWERTA
jgi:hypothetical protein